MSELDELVGALGGPVIHLTVSIQGIEDEVSVGVGSVIAGTAVATPVPILARHRTSPQAFRAMLAAVADHRAPPLLETHLLEQIPVPPRADPVRHGWYWSHALQGYARWLTVCESYSVTTSGFEEWVRANVGAYRDDEPLEAVQRRVAKDTFEACVSALRGAAVAQQPIGSSQTSPKTRPQRRESHLPDVWGYSDAYFDLQRALSARVEDHLECAGYARVLEVFEGEKEAFELTKSPKTTSSKSPMAHTTGQTDFSLSTPARVSLSDVFSAWGTSPITLPSRSTVDLSEVAARNTVKQLILAGDVEKALAVLDRTFPTLLQRFPAVGHRLRHLELEERIRAHYADPTNLSEAQEKVFLNATMDFVAQHLASPEVARDSELLAAMEHTMALLTTADGESSSIGAHPGADPGTIKPVGAPLDPEHSPPPPSRALAARMANHAMWAFTQGGPSSPLDDFARLLAWSFASKGPLAHCAAITVPPP